MFFHSAFKLGAIATFVASALLLAQAEAADATSMHSNLRKNEGQESHGRGRALQAATCLFGNKQYSVGEEVHCWDCPYDYCTCLEGQWGTGPYWGNCRNEPAPSPPTWPNPTPSTPTWPSPAPPTWPTPTPPVPPTWPTPTPPTPPTPTTKCNFEGKDYNVGEEVYCWNCAYDYCTCLQTGKWGNCRN